MLSQSQIESSTSGASHTQHIPNTSFALMVWNPCSQDVDIVRPILDVLSRPNMCVVR